MKISTKLKGSAMLIIGITFIFVGAVLYVSVKAGQAGERNQIAQKLLETSVTGVALRAEYSLTGEDRPKVQWYALQATFNNILDLEAPLFTEPANQTLYAAIRDNQERKKVTFDAVVSAIERGDNPELVARLNSQLAVTVQDGVSISTRLAELSREEHGAFHQMLKTIIGGVGLFVIFFALISYFVSRRISSSLTTLQQEFARIITLIDEGKLVEVKTPGYTFRNTPMDKFLLAFQFTQAKLENDNKGVDVKKGLEQKAKMGHPPMPAIPGYINVGSQKGFKEWAPDPVRFDLHRKIFDLILSGINPAKVFRMVNNEWGYKTLRRGTKIGGKPLAKSAFYRILSDIKYTANFEHSGKWYKGAYPAMITMDEFDRIQVLLGKKGRPRPQINDVPYTGLMTCHDCKASISYDVLKQAICAHCKHKFSIRHRTDCPTCHTDLSDMENPTLLTYVYYNGTKNIDPNCENCSKGVEIKPLETQIDQQLQTTDIDSDYLKLALDYLEETEGVEGVTDKKIKESLELALNNVNTRINNLDKNFNAPQNANYELYTPERYQELMSPLKEERKGIEGQLKANNDSEPKVLELTRDTYKFCGYSRYWLRKGDNDTKNAVLSGISPNLTLDDRKLRFEAYEPHLIIGNALKTIKEQSDSSEPENNGSIKGQNDTFVSLSPYWLAEQDGFRTLG